jgi:hypothetical protein
MEPNIATLKRIALDGWIVMVSIYFVTEILDFSPVGCPQYLQDQQTEKRIFTRLKIPRSALNAVLYQTAAASVRFFATRRECNCTSRVRNFF